MKRIVISKEAEAALEDILLYTIRQWVNEQADAYAQQLLKRLRALAKGELPHARPCEMLMRGGRSAAGLKFIREGAHYLIVREAVEEVALVELFHVSMDVEQHLTELTRRLAESRRRPKG